MRNKEEIRDQYRGGRSELIGGRSIYLIVNITGDMATYYMSGSSHQTGNSSPFNRLAADQGLD